MKPNDDVLSVLSAACRERKLLLVWADVPFPPQQRLKRPRPLVIQAWQADAARLAPLPEDLSTWPPLPILSLDPTARWEAALADAATVLTSAEVIQEDRPTVLKLAGDLASPSTLLLTWEDVRAARSSGMGDKAHILREAQRVVQAGVLLVVAPRPEAAWARLWAELMIPLAQAAAKGFVIGPEAYAWPAPLHPVPDLSLDALSAHLVATCPRRPPPATCTMVDPDVHYHPVHLHIFEPGAADAAIAQYPVALEVPGSGRAFTRRVMHLDLDRLVAHSAQSAAYGQALGEALFAPAGLGADYREVRAFLAGQFARPRLTLHVEPAALHDVRWERLTYPVDGAWQPLAATADALLARTVPTEGWGIPQPLTACPLRVLVLIASPEDGMDATFTPITQAESAMWHALFDALPGVEVTYLERGAAHPPTLSQLKAHLIEGYHLAHIVGHGQATVKHGTVLYLEDEQGRADGVSAAALLEAFRTPTRRPHFCFLAACASGERRASAFLPLGPALVAQGGVPAVVAMAERVSLETARQFAQHTYTRLFTHGYVDLAVHEARALVRERWDWSVPVLYSRLPDNRLIRWGE